MSAQKEWHVHPGCVCGPLFVVLVFRWYVNGLVVVPGGLVVAYDLGRSQVFGRGRVEWIRGSPGCWKGNEPVDIIFTAGLVVFGL
jgi:hypothetical protein